MARKRGPEAEALRACRSAMNLTQAEFAEALGLSTACIVRWENEMRSPPRLGQRHLVVHEVTRLRPDLASALAEGLGVERSPASAPAKSPRTPVDARTLRDSVYRAAERLDVPAGRFRAELATLVKEWSAASWDVREIAKQLG